MTWDEFNKQEMDRRAQAQQSMYQVNLRADDTAYNRDQDALRQQVAAKARDDALSHQDAVMAQQQQFHADQQKNQADVGEEHKAAQKQQLDEFTARQAQQQQYNLERAQALADQQMNEAIRKAGDRDAAPHLLDAAHIANSGLSDTDAVNAAHDAAMARAQEARDAAARRIYTRMGKPIPDELQPQAQDASTIAPAQTIPMQEPIPAEPGADWPMDRRVQNITDYPVDNAPAKPMSASDILSRARAERDRFKSRNDTEHARAEAEKERMRQESIDSSKALHASTNAARDAKTQAKQEHIDNYAELFKEKMDEQPPEDRSAYHAARIAQLEGALPSNWRQNKFLNEEVMQMQAEQDQNRENGAINSVTGTEVWRRTHKPESDDKLTRNIDFRRAIKALAPGAATAMPQTQTAPQGVAPRTIPSTPEVGGGDTRNLQSRVMPMGAGTTLPTLTPEQAKDPKIPSGTQFRTLDGRIVTKA